MATFITAYANDLERIYVNDEGAQLIRQGGTRSWRNNNPGNISYGEFARQEGAIGTDGRFAIFPSADVGRQAQVDLLRTSKYQALSIAQAITRWAPPSENDSEAYIAAVISQTGFPREQKLSSMSIGQLGQLADAMAQHEGYQGGSEFYNHPPEVSVSNATLNPGEAIALSELFKFYDPDAGDSVVAFAVQDRTKGGGYLTKDGRPQAEQKVFDDQPISELSRWKFVAAKYDAVDELGFNAIDTREAFNKAAVATIETHQPDNRHPVVVAQDQAVKLGEKASIQKWFVTSDEDDDKIVTYGLLDTNGGANSGHLLKPGGKEQPAGEWLLVSSSEFKSVRYQGGKEAGSEMLQTKVYDGQDWSDVASLNVTTTQERNKPVTITAKNQVLDNDWESVKDWVKGKDPDGDPIGWWAFYDSETDPKGASFRIDGAGLKAVNGEWVQTSGVQAAQTIVAVSDNELSLLRFGGAQATGKELLYVTAWDGIDWSDWKAFTVTIDDDALLV